MKTPLLLLAVALLAACGKPPAPEDMMAPDFMGGGQMVAEVKATYDGPYGVGVGSVIKNYAFYGFAKATLDKTALKQVTLGDFYNPDGASKYADGSPYGAGNAKPLALVIDRSAVWCEPCNWEAQNELPGKHTQYSPKGEFLLALDEGSERGSTPTQADLTAWVTRYHVDYPATVNPQASLSAIVGIDAYPGHIIVRTKDMKIIKWVAGIPDDSFWQLYQDVLDGKPVLPDDPH
jgi:hypothetical protein